VSDPRLLARVWSNEHHGWLTQTGTAYVVDLERAGWFLPSFAHELVSEGGTTQVEGLFLVPVLSAIYAWATESVTPARR
jgi:hypothetical protein